MASIRALHELLSNVPPATSSSCSSLTASGFWISSLILWILVGWVLGWVGSAADLNLVSAGRRKSYPTMTVASIRALQELLSNVPPATSSSCSSLTVSGFWISSLILWIWLVGLVWFGWLGWTIGLISERRILGREHIAVCAEEAPRHVFEFCIR